MNRTGFNASGARLQVFSAYLLVNERPNRWCASALMRLVSIERPSAAKDGDCCIGTVRYSWYFSALARFDIWAWFNLHLQDERLLRRHVEQVDSALRTKSANCHFRKTVDS